MLAPVEPRLNPYADLLAKGIRRAGCRCVVQRSFSFRWYLTTWRELDVLHLHWLEFCYLAESTAGTIRKLISLLAALIIARLVGTTIVYTVHNVVAHTVRYPRLNWLANQTVFRLADAIHVHDGASSETIAMRFGRALPTYVAPHGSYIGVYPNSCDRATSRLMLTLPDSAFVYLFLGQIRPNKGIEDLITAFRQLQEQNALLLIAGWAPDETYGASVDALVGEDNRIVVHRRFVEETEIQCYLNASDICVLPYRSVTTSGAALLAFSFGRPIVAPKLGCFPELVSGSRGILYDGAMANGLLQALRASRDLDLRAAKNDTLGLAESRDWPTIARQHLFAYRRPTIHAENGRGARKTEASPSRDRDESVRYSS